MATPNNITNADKFLALALAGLCVFWVAFTTEAFSDGHWLAGGTFLGFALGHIRLFYLMLRAIRNPRPPAEAKQDDVIRSIPMHTIYGLPRGNYVYLIMDTYVTGYCKIGKATNPYERITHGFGAKLPFDFTLLAILPCQNMTQLETSLHKRFILKRVRGTEWFRLTHDDIRYIQELAQ